VANLTTANLTLREVMELEVGDVISLSLPDVVSAEVDGVAVADCRYGMANGQYALKVERVRTLPDEQTGVGHG
jgi:flagellar motor switch protein FliM